MHNQNFEYNHKDNHYNDKNKSKVEKTSIFSIVVNLHIASIIANIYFDNNSIFICRNNFFNDINNISPLLKDLWKKHFPDQEIHEFKDELLEIFNTAKDISYGIEGFTPSDYKLNEHTFINSSFVSDNFKQHKTCSLNVNTKLVSLISQINIAENNNLKAYLPLKHFSYDSIFPEINNTNMDYYNELNGISNNELSNIELTNIELTSNNLFTNLNNNAVDNLLNEQKPYDLPESFTQKNINSISLESINNELDNNSINQNDNNENIYNKKGRLFSKLFSIFKNKNDDSVIFENQEKLTIQEPDNSQEEIINNDSEETKKNREFYKETYKLLVEDIGNAFKKHKDSDSYINLTATIDSILFKYLSNVPANFNEALSEISLYEHGKVTAAFASVALMQHLDNALNNENNFMIIRGDFFSIQSFIFNKNITSINTANSLRGKSFYVSLLSDISSIYILEKLELPYFNIMINAAGTFIIIANNNYSNSYNIEEINKNIENYLYHEFYASVSLGISHIPCSKQDFLNNNFNLLFLKLLEQKEKAKLSRFNLHNRENIVFQNYNQNFNESSHICSHCGLELVYKKNYDNDYLCKKCQFYDEIGAKLRNKTYLYIYEDSQGIYNKYAIDFKDNNNEHDKRRIVLRMHIDLEDNKSSEVNSYNAIHYRSYVALDNHGKIKTFEKLAKTKNNSNYLSVLKADVDNLGTIFACGLAHKNSNGDVVSSNLTFSKINMLSRSIQNFFSYYLYSIMSGEKIYNPIISNTNVNSNSNIDSNIESNTTSNNEISNNELNYLQNKNLYTVFAGGDDLFIIGGYNTIIQFAKVLNKEFKKFTNFNSETTLSMGIGIFNHYTPIWIMAEATEELLEKAKKHKEFNDIHGFKKGNISILHSTSKIDKFFVEYNDFNNAIDSNKFSITFTKDFYYDILKYCKMKEDPTKNENLLWRSLLNYKVEHLKFNIEDYYKEKRELKKQLIYNIENNIENNIEEEKNTDNINNFFTDMFISNNNNINDINIDNTQNINNLNSSNISENSTFNESNADESINEQTIDNKEIKIQNIKDLFKSSQYHKEEIPKFKENKKNMLKIFFTDAIHKDSELVKTLTTLRIFDYRRKK